MRSTIALGVPAGATRPYQKVESNPFSPTDAPASVRSGTEGMDGVGVVTP